MSIPFEMLTSIRSGELGTYRQERRRSPRVPLRVRTRVTFFAGGVESEEWVTVRDVGFQGVSFLMDRPFAAGHTFTLKTPSSDGSLVTWQGTVCRCFEQGSQYVVGASLAMADESAKAA